MNSKKILIDPYTPGMPSTTDFLKLYHVVSRVWGTGESCFHLPMFQSNEKYCVYTGWGLKKIKQTGELQSFQRSRWPQWLSILSKVICNNKYPDFLAICFWTSLFCIDQFLHSSIWPRGKHGKHTLFCVLLTEYHSQELFIMNSKTLLKYLEWQWGESSWSWGAGIWIAWIYSHIKRSIN